MISKVKVAVAIACLVTAGALSARPQCIELAWTGGAAGEGVKWVKGKLSERGQNFTVRYDWKNGIMTGQIQPDGTLAGNWIQDGSGGGKFKFAVPDSGQATGWWSSNADKNVKKNEMLIRVCE
ncbi:MAG: hypothetical protein K8S54_16430 [Spirochaetia bacterium]|nr:hypothetical protein [Spirochaetia bacterium]